MIGLIIVGVALFFFASAGYAIYKLIAAKQQRDAFEGDHRGWETYVSSVNHWLIAISPDSSQVALGHGRDPKTYPIGAVAAVEILKDGSSITSTNRGSQMAGALLGGMALGEVGALLGGLSGSKWNKNTVHSIALKVVVDDRAAPVHSIVFFRSPEKKGTESGSFELKRPVASADKFHALLITGMKKAAANSATAQLPPTQKTATEELQRLWELKQAGALTEDEFSAHKARLLSN